MCTILDPKNQSKFINWKLTRNGKIIMQYEFFPVTEFFVFKQNQPCSLKYTQQTSVCALNTVTAAGTSNKMQRSGGQGRLCRV